jgi:DNA-directed RNA polymerase specialized sigma24 family protein
MNGEPANLLTVLEPGTFERIVLTAFELSPEHREVFFLCDMQDFTIAETGTILGSVTSRWQPVSRVRAKRWASACEVEQGRVEVPSRRSDGSEVTIAADHGSL